jgi:hypothetical protein
VLDRRFGLGKSTLVEQVLYPALQHAKGKAGESALAHRELRGAELIGGPRCSSIRNPSAEPRAPTR